MQKTTLSKNRVLNNWKAGPPNSPPVRSPVNLVIPYCQSLSSIFVLPIYDWDFNELECTNNFMSGIILSIPPANVAFVIVGGQTLTASTTLPYKFNAVQTIQIRVDPIPQFTETTSFQFTADDNNGGGAFANTATVSITIMGDTPPVGQNFSIGLTECNPISPIFKFPVSDIDQLTSVCSAFLFIILIQVPPESIFQLFHLSSNGTGIPITEAEMPLSLVSTTQFYVVGPPAGSNHHENIVYNVFDGILENPYNSRLHLNYSTGGPANVASVQLIIIGCQGVTDPFSISVTETRCAPIDTMTYMVPSPSQGVLYYNPNTGPTSVYTAITNSNPIDYSPNTLYQFHLPDVVRNSYRVSIQVNALNALTDAKGTGFLNISIGGLPLLQQPANLTIQFPQCNLQSLPFQLPTNANNSIYVGCASGLQQILSGSLPNPNTQGILTVSLSGNINGPYTSILSLPLTVNYNAYFLFTSPSIWNSIDIHYSLKFQTSTNYTGIPERTASSTLNIYINASQAKIPEPTVKTSVSVQAGQTIKIDMTGMPGGCAAQAPTNLFNWLIVALPTAGSSPTQNGSLFFYDPYSLPYGEGDRIPSPGISTQSITGLVNGVSGTYSTYIDPDPSGELVYAPPFPTNLDTNAHIISTDAFYFFMQYGERFSVYAGAVKISITNPLQGISTIVTLDENTQIPFQMFGTNVPANTVAIITSLTGQGQILFHGIPISFPFTIAFSPFTDSTPPDLNYKPPLNIFGNNLGIVNFHMEYTGGLESPQSYTVSFDVTFVNQPPTGMFVPLQPVYFNLSSIIQTVPNNITQNFNVTIKNTNSFAPIYPYTLSIYITSPSTLSVCCLAGNDYYRLIGGSQNSQFIQIYSQLVYLNEFMHFMSFHIRSPTPTSPSPVAQFITFTIYDNDPINAKTSTYNFEILVVGT